MDLEVPDPDEIGIALALAVGYLAGSIPSGYWLVRVLLRDDIRRHGSGNIGATNVWRVYERKYGVPVVLLDTAKGFVPAFVFLHTVSPLAGVLAGGAAMAGHWRPLFLKFARGARTSGASPAGRRTASRFAGAEADPSGPDVSRCQAPGHARFAATLALQRFAGTAITVSAASGCQARLRVVEGL